MSVFLVTGASGAFGAHFANAVLSQGHEVISIMHDERPTTTADLIGIYNKITWIRGDLLNANLCKRVVADYGVDAIYHFAALPIVQVATRTTVPIFDVNLMGTIHLLEAVRESAWAGKNIRFIYISTDKVYGDAGARPYKEDMPLNGLGLYECSKACADLTVRSYATCQFIPAAAVIRPCNVICQGDLNLGRVLPRTIVPSIRGERPILYRTPYLREFIDVYDAIHGILAVDKLLQQGRGHGEAFNVGSGQQFTLEQTVNSVLKHFSNIEPQWIDPPEISRIEIPFQKLDTTKIRENTSWKPVTTFEDSVRDLVHWWKSHWGRLPTAIKEWRVTGWH